MWFYQFRISNNRATIKASENDIIIDTCISYVCHRILYHLISADNRPISLSGERSGVHDNKTVTPFFRCPRRWQWYEEESEYWREQINLKIVIQICRNDFHPKSIPKVPWESPSISSASRTYAEQHTYNVTLAPRRMSTAWGERRPLFLSLSIWD